LVFDDLAKQYHGMALGQAIREMQATLLRKG